MADEPPMVELMAAAPMEAMSAPPARLYKMAGGGGERGEGHPPLSPHANAAERPAQPPAGAAHATAGGDAAQTVDLTAVPAQLEAAYDALDVDAAIRPTKINVGEVWRRRSQLGLLATP